MLTKMSPVNDNFKVEYVKSRDGMNWAATLGLNNTNEPVGWGQSREESIHNLRMILEDLSFS